MGDALLGGSVAAAFVAGMVAFFAPCCATVMLPSYLACATGGHRWQVLRLSSIYIAGVAMVVWPLTIGVAGLSATISRYHSALFIGGGAMMIAVGAMVLRGKMWSPSLPQPRTGADTASVFLMGAFAGAATACCAPVLAGAVALSALTGTVLGGAILGAAYLLGLVAPLLVAALLIERYQRRLREPIVRLRLAGRNIRIGVLRLIAGAAFLLIGIGVATLGLLGQADRAPGPQRAVGLWLQQHITSLARGIPDLVILAAVVAFLGLVAYRIVRPTGSSKGKEPLYEQQGTAVEP